MGRTFPWTIMVALLAVLTLGASCATSAKFDYAQAEGVMFKATGRTPMPPVTVVPFLDRRPPKALGEEASESVKAGMTERGDFRLGWIPFLPYAWISRQIPENPEVHLATLRSFWCNFDRELAEAAVASIRHSELFQDVFFAEKPEQATTRYLLQGTLLSSEYQGERLTYGLTYLLSPALWVCGFPMAVSHNSLSMVFRLVDRERKEVLWRFRFDGENRHVQFLYGGVGADASGYAILMKQAMNAVLYDLEQKVEKARQDGVTAPQ
ncbi:MAG: hypothetical protein ACI4SG_07610 [Oligosphaeraceae bacterium]